MKNKMLFSKKTAVKFGIFLLVLLIISVVIFGDYRRFYYKKDFHPTIKNWNITKKLKIKKQIYI